MRQINKILIPYFCTIYILLVLTETLFTLQINSWSAATLLVIVPSLFFYPAVQLLPAAAVSQIAAWAVRKLKKGQMVIVGIITVVCVYVTHLFLLLDAGLYLRYGYHINPHVINIFTTPGGFEGMGLCPNEIAMIVLGMVLLAVVHSGIFLLFAKNEKMRFIQIASPKALVLPAAIAGSAFIVSYMTYTYSHFMMNPVPLQAAESIPFYISGTSGSFYKKLGFKKPPREGVKVKFQKNAHLQAYPAASIRRNSKRSGYNVLWLACESWAARLFSPEIMPNASAFARKGIFFKNHYSGGNVTRQGVFSMFYALPGNYWHAFLAARRRPVFIDWLQEDGYQFKCITSSKFTYPEFDQTVFFSIEQKDLVSDSEGATYMRDQRNVKHLLKTIAENADSGKPFFNFMFFESCHHPYSFPPEAAFYKDYIEPFNAVNATAANGPAIFKRAANCARHLDMRLGEIFNLLEEKDLLKNTIVVLAGDHGEEFFEKGRLGHSSAFNNEQTRTPLILYYPGIKPGIYSKMSSHLDIVPMIAGFFGVENDPEDYSCGVDLLAEGAPERRYSLIADWDKVFFAGKKFKSYIPLDAIDLARQTITDADDRKLEDVSLFYKEYKRDLIKVQKDLTRFTAPATLRKNSRRHSYTPFLLGAIVASVLGGMAGILIYRKKKRT